MRRINAIVASCWIYFTITHSDFAIFIAFPLLKVARTRINVTSYVHCQTCVGSIMAEEVRSLAAEGPTQIIKNKQTKVTVISKIENEIFLTKAHVHSIW